MSNVPLKPARRGALTLVAGRRDAGCRAAHRTAHLAQDDPPPAMPDAALPPRWFEEWIGYVGERADVAPSPKRSG
ncbi:hypothetical protein AB4851_29805 [Burkholderia sp. 22PA0099]|uniref:hypothetical protein n=1 Tax=Burkholderia sp. 22PA0099 TaxID=3237372 RepID=UPI0039C020D0